MWERDQPAPVARAGDERAPCCMTRGEPPGTQASRHRVIRCLCLPPSARGTHAAVSPAGSQRSSRLGFFISASAIPHCGNSDCGKAEGPTLLPLQPWQPHRVFYKMSMGSPHVSSKQREGQGPTTPVRC